MRPRANKRAGVDLRNEELMSELVEMLSEPCPGEVKEAA